MKELQEEILMNRKGFLAIMAAAVLLLASSCTANLRPVITSLEAEADWTAPSSNLNVTCTASDRDGDELRYNWSASGGNITGTGPEITWTAPEEIGVYDITVVVDDGHDGEDTSSVILIAANGTLPIIEDLIVTAREPKYLKEISYGYKVGKGKEYDIECIASNTSSELAYEWLCDGGEISGEGSMITWTAPDTSDEVTVMVIVFDAAGYTDNESIIFVVVSCTSCEFG
jgi:FlaG/FlaF family flagellin (archaellin)